MTSVEPKLVYLPVMPWLTLIYKANIGRHSYLHQTPGLSGLVLHIQGRLIQQFFTLTGNIRRQRRSGLDRTFFQQ